MHLPENYLKRAALSIKEIHALGKRFTSAAGHGLIGPWKLAIKSC